MKKALSQIIEIPEGVEANVSGAEIIVKGTEGENKREFNFANLKLEKEDNKIIIGNKNASKKEKKQMNTIAAHIKNMIKGVQKKFEYTLKICFSHFPITVEINGSEVLIKNFLGERTPRKMKLPEGVDVNVGKEIITITSTNREAAGQAAANFENVTKIPNKDRRIFQDGIFITNKCGREI